MNPATWLSSKMWLVPLAARQQKRENHEPKCAASRGAQAGKKTLHISPRKSCRHRSGSTEIRTAEWLLWRKGYESRASNVISLHGHPVASRLPCLVHSASI